MEKKIKIFDRLSIVLAIAIFCAGLFFLNLSLQGREIINWDEEVLYSRDIRSDYHGASSTNKGQKIIFKVKVTNGTADVYLYRGKPKEYTSEIEEKDMLFNRTDITETKIKYTVKDEKYISLYVDTYGKKDVKIDYIVKEKYHVAYLLFSSTFFVITFIIFYGIIKNIIVKRKVTLDIKENRVFDLILKYLSKNNYIIESKNPKLGKIVATRVTFLKTTGEKYDFIIERLSKNTSRLLISVKTIHNISHNSRYFTNNLIDEMIDFIKNSGKSRKGKK